MDDLKLIKKHYGEKMSHLCRDLFPTILETPGLLFKVLSDKFEYSKFLYDDIVDNGLINSFKEYIYSLIDCEENIEKIDTTKSPFELMDEAGYTLYECKTENDIQRFKKYYKPGEEICTFKGGRLNTCHVFFAVKKNVDEIVREDFKNPKREDEYGTSVISIQFSKGDSNYLSIKNRYNHTVTNPDATFSNDLDNIIPGLTDAFMRHYRYNVQNSSNRFEIPNYVRTFDGKYYKYNYEINNIYYCANNVIIENGKIKEEYLDKNRYLVFDYFILDLKEKKIIIIDNSNKFDESFNEVINDLDDLKIEIVKTKDGNKNIIFEIDFGKKIIITIDKQNRMISYYDDINDYIPMHFFAYVGYITNEIVLNNVYGINDYFISNDENVVFNLKKFYAPKLEIIGNCFMAPVESIENFFTPKLKIVGNAVLSDCTLVSYDLSNLKIAGNGFLRRFERREIYLPKLTKVGGCFLDESSCIECVDFPNLKEAGSYFISKAPRLRKINIPKLSMIGEHSLKELFSLEELDIPCVEFIPNHFLQKAAVLKKLSMPKAKYIDTMVLSDNDCLEYLSAPLVKNIRSYFLGGYSKLSYINLNKSAEVDNNFAGLYNGFWIPSIGIIIGNEKIVKYINKMYQKYNEDNPRNIHRLHLPQSEESNAKPDRPMTLLKKK